jgi:predicted DNA-binding transcriptional regulator AlpA
MYDRPKKHHLDRRADQLVAAAVGDDSDELLSTQGLAAWLGVSTQWLEIGRVKGYGPKWKKLGPHQIRYRRSDVLKWLNARTYQRTAQYTKQRRSA